ncbi:MAG TPA: tRNA (adenosine(37)-N6)-dimethylallyltransferase MiaA [Patescibacteria group bacterium]|nr:tRNA (adenosine(37)-N6)-dimethylallyltransferase MiaA [Patescibacteria group bacterium]
MASIDDRPLVVIVGQTASGKSDLAIRIAKKHNGEVICADSRTVYAGMDIGTAKPSSEDRRTIPHHLLDLIEPDQTYSASKFKEDSAGVLADIYSKDKLPIIVGGTGLYIDSLVYDYDFGKAPDVQKRLQLQDMELADLQQKAKELNLNGLQINFTNRRHLIRAIENGGIVRTKKHLREHTLIVGLSIGKEKLRERISRRNDHMISTGLKDEVRRLAEKYGWDAPGLNAIAYKEWRGYFEGRETIDEIKKKMFKDNWQYARRQKIWFKRDANIHWFTSTDKLIRQVDQFLIQY